MYPSLTPPRQVKIGDAGAFAGTTPRAIRHYHEIGLLPEPEPERGGDGRRCYGYDDMIHLLWIRKMAAVGISLDDMRAAFAEARDIEEILSRLEETLAAREAEIKRQRAAVHCLQEVGSPLGLLAELVTGRLSHLPPGALRPSDLDALLVTERVFGPLGAAVQASVLIVLAPYPDLRAEDDRLDAAEAALDDGADAWAAIVAGTRHDVLRGDGRGDARSPSRTLSRRTGHSVASNEGGTAHQPAVSNAMRPATGTASRG